MTSGAIARARYRIVDSIGRGGMGEVCLADDLVLDRQVALKFLTSTSGGEMERLLAEARAAAALDHPFICSIYDISSLDDRPCIAMEYVRGETLERRLRRGPLPLPDALRIAEEIAEALEAAHNRRVVHRDLKPANVMLTADQHVKVMDFGLAAWLPAGKEGGADGVDAGAPSDTVQGTPAYMAPEQIRGAPADRRSDIFAFGILLYEVLSGANPFVRPGADATLAAILGERPPDLHHRVPTVPAAVGAAVARMLAKDPAERYPSFGEVRRDLRRLAAERPAASPRPVPAVTARRHREASAALVGREAERAALLDALAHGGAGRGGFVLLSGDPGLGKTTLAADAADAAQQRGFHALVGRCCERSGTPPLTPYIEVLEEAARVMPAASFRQAAAPGAAELARLLPELHRLFPDMPPALELPAHLRQRFLFTNVREFLARASRDAPLLVVLDDLQWADESTLQLTQHLVPQLSTLPIVVLGTYRETEPEPAVARGAIQQLFDRVRGQARQPLAAEAIKRALDDLVHQSHGRAIALRPFTGTDVRRMLAALSGDEPPARIAEMFALQTGGNPFFVAELFRHLKEEGRLLDARGRWKRDATLDEMHVPESVKAVLERRLRRVSTGTQDVLRAAAVIGRDFELDLLQAVAQIGDDALSAALDEAEHARLLTGPSGRQDLTWRFAHPLICRTLTQQISTLRRQRLHLRVADVMEHQTGAAGLRSSEVAHHLYCAGRAADATRTARALTSAGDSARDMYATYDAVQHYRRALEVLRAGGDAVMRRGVEERLADALALLGEGAAAMAHYETLAGASDAAPDGVARARITRKMGALHWQSGNRTEAMACYDRALAAIEQAPPHVEAAHLYQELGLAAFRTGDNARAIEWARRALHAAEAALAEAASPAAPDLRKEAATAVAHATNTIGVALARSGELEAARSHIERSVAAARELGLLDVACRGYSNLGVLYTTVEPKRAIDVSLTGLELASRIGAAALQSYIYANLAAAYCALTERCESEGLRAARAAAELDREIGQLDHLAVPLVVMAQIHQCRGQLDEAQRNYDEALALAERTGEPQLILPCYDGLATICLDRGDRARAAEYMEKAKEICSRHGLDPDALLLLPFLS